MQKSLSTPEGQAEDSTVFLDSMPLEEGPIYPPH